MFDLDDEIRSHLEHEIDDNVARGMTREEAEFAARRKFGNRTRVKEDVWRLRPWAWLDGVRQDFRYALRMMRKSWGFTAIAVLSLALGIGGNTALFSLVDRLMLRTLPVREPERLVGLQVMTGGRPMSWFSYRDCENLRKLEFFEGIIGWHDRRVDVDWDGTVRSRLLHLVTGEYFPALGVSPVIGRLLDAKDDSPAGGDAAVLSYAVWEREFQMNPSVLGQRFRWDRGTFTVVGVLPAAFRGVDFGPAPEIFLSLHGLRRAQPADKRFDGDLMWISLLARLKTGVDRAQVELVLTERWRALVQAETPYYDKFLLQPGSTGHSGMRGRFGYSLWLLLGLSGIVLLAVCANLASLQLLRADSRRREMSIRAAAGATEGRIVRLWFIESLLVAGAGGLAGLIACGWLTRGLLLFLPQYARAFFEFGLDGRVLLVSLVGTVATTLLFGVIPGWRAAREANWRDAGRGSAGERAARWSRPAIVLQLAVSLVLILGGALFARSVQNLVRANLGFDREGLVVMGLERSPDLTVAIRRNRGLALLAQLRNSPQVKAAALAWYVPLIGGSWWAPLKVPGHVPAPGENTMVFVDAVSPGYFATLGIPQLAGRDFDDHDTLGAQPVAIVSESVARRYFGRMDVIGEVVSAGVDLETKQLRIVGVVGNSIFKNVRAPIKDLLYISLLQVPGWRGEAIARPQPGVSPSALIATVRALGARPEIKARLEPWEYSVAFNNSIQQDRMVANLAAVFGGLGAALALIGLYGSMAYAVSLRTAEFGIRMALGGSPSRIAWMVVRQAGILAALGLMAGVPLSALASRLVAASLFHIQPLDPLAIAAVAVIMTAVSLAAALVPALRAARVDPAVALRAE